MAVKDRNGLSRIGNALVAIVPDICIVEHDEKLASEVADFFIRSAGEVKNRPFRVALSGGSTPSKLYRLLAAADCANRVKWPHVQFTESC
jgi:6-phosphogluconolactonase/glucosamine-6-phosphate isomerase/deaminase